MLDPSDWNAFRTLAHRALDDAIDYVEHVDERPAWKEMPKAAREALNETMPRNGEPLADVYHEFTQNILPYNCGNIHPRFFGWVQGGGTATGIVAEMLAATMNSNVGGRNHAAVYVERAVIKWFLKLFTFPETASGVMTVGTSAANLIAVVVARTHALGPAAREQGNTATQKRLTGYASTATHGCVRRAFEVAGLGSESLRILPTDGNHRLDPRALEHAIAEDRAAGHEPFMVIGNAGSVDVGAIDPLEEIGIIARREHLWYHVDGAFGATAILAPSVAPRLKGIELADSIAFDFHKWLNVQYDAGCLIVRDGETHRAAFASTPSYLTRMSRGLASGQPWFTDYTIDLSRSFRALKVWFTIKEHGSVALGKTIEENIRQAQILGDLIDRNHNFELLAPVQLNVVCFRHRADGLSGQELDAFNDELVIRLQESGIAVTSSTTVNDRRAIRVCIVNQRTRNEDITLLINSLQELATEMLPKR